MKRKNIILILLLLFSNIVKLNAIENISINNYNLIPNFDKNTKVYNVFVNGDKEIITINAVASENEMVTGTGSKSLKAGLNEIEIKSYENDIETNSYLIKITRGESKHDKSNSLLKSLSIEGYDIDFQKDTTDYQIEAKADDKRLYIDYETFNPKEIVKVSGNVILTDKNNVIELEVISEDKKSMTTYRIKVDKKIVDKEKKKSKISIFDGKDFSEDELKWIKDIIIFIEIIIISLLFYFIVIKKRPNKVLYIKHNILRK